MMGSNGVEMDPPTPCLEVAAVIVTFQPELQSLRTLVGEVLEQVESVYLVDNSRPEWLDGLSLESLGARLKVMRLGQNTGIAHASNLGVDRAARDAFPYVLLLDQDSRPGPAMVRMLLAALEDAHGLPEGRRVVAAGPALRDGTSGRTVIYPNGRWGPKAEYQDEAMTSEALPVGYLPASGALISVASFRELGGFREDLFIDHVDLEWGMRVSLSGMSSVVVPQAVLEHRLADESREIPLLGHRMSLHSDPRRDYFNVRNAILIARQRSTPGMWVVGLLGRQVRWAVATLLAARGTRLRRARCMLRGVFDGFSGKGGAGPF